MADKIIPSTKEIKVSTGGNELFENAPADLRISITYINVANKTKDVIVLDSNQTWKTAFEIMEISKEDAKNSELTINGVSISPESFENRSNMQVQPGDEVSISAITCGG